MMALAKHIMNPFLLDGLINTTDECVGMQSGLF